MKRYVYSSSLHELKSSLYGILGLFDDIEKIDLKPMGDNATKVIIRFSDGKQAEMIARYGAKRQTKNVPSNWDPSYHVADDGTVYDSNNKFVGYIKILQRKPEQTVRFYDTDNIQVSFGAEFMYLLNDDTVDEIVSKLYREYAK